MDATDQRRNQTSNSTGYDYSSPYFTVVDSGSGGGGGGGGYDYSSLYHRAQAYYALDQAQNAGNEGYSLGGRVSERIEQREVVASVIKCVIRTIAIVGVILVLLRIANKNCPPS